MLIELIYLRLLAYQVFWIVLSSTHGKLVYCRVSGLATVCEVLSGVVSELVFRNTMDRGT